MSPDCRKWIPLISSRDLAIWTGSQAHSTQNQPRYARIHSPTLREKRPHTINGLYVVICARPRVVSGSQGDGLPRERADVGDVECVIVLHHAQLARHHVVRVRPREVDCEGVRAARSACEAAKKSKCRMMCGAWATVCARIVVLKPTNTKMKE